MVEAQQGLGHGSENSPRKDLTTADKLVLAYNASQDFIIAAGILDSVEDSKYKENAALKISRELVQSGREPLFPPSHFLEEVNQRESWNRNDMYEGISLLQADMGDLPGALQTAELTHGFPWYYINLAKIVNQHSENPIPVFKKALEKESRAGDNDQVRTYGQLAKVQLEFGLDGKPLLDAAKAKAETNNWKNDWYNLELATWYARCGYPQDALEVMTKIDYNSEQIAPHGKAEVLSLIAIAQARNRIDPSEIVTMTIEQTEAIKSFNNYHPQWMQAQIYANLSRAYASYGLDPRPLIGRAIQKVQADPSNLGADSYVEIAKAELSYGADARSTLVLALERADNILEPDDKDESGYGSIIQLSIWEDIFHTQVTGEYLSDARQTLERIDKYSSDQGILARKAELMAELAVEEAKRGLSQGEINGLSQEQVREILRSPNELAAQAVVYFELDNKLL